MVHLKVDFRTRIAAIETILSVHISAMEFSPEIGHHISSASKEKIEDTPPPTNLERGHQDTPMVPKRGCGRGRNLLKIIKGGTTKSESLPTSPVRSPRRDPKDTKVSFRNSVEAIPVSHLVSINQSQSENESDEAEGEGDSTEGEIDDDDDSIANMADRSSSSTSTVRDLVNSFVFVDVGPNISDTVHEFTNLLTNIATRSPTAIRTATEEE